MDITVGRSIRAEGPGASSVSPPAARGEEILGRVVGVRPANARERQVAEEAARRGAARGAASHPVTLAIVIPDGARLPGDLATGDYRVVVRLVREPARTPPAAGPGPSSGPAGDAGSVLGERYG